jgi:hypothetical protein
MTNGQVLATSVFRGSFVPDLVLLITGKRTLVKVTNFNAYLSNFFCIFT